MYTILLTEIKMLNKVLSKKFPFILDVSGYEIHRGKLIIDAWVSPNHFCELMDDRVENKVNSSINAFTTQAVKTIVSGPSKDFNVVDVRYFPLIEKSTLLEYVDKIN